MPHYTITVNDTDTLWTATSTHPAITTTGVTLRDALDELALCLDRYRREQDNAPHVET